MFWLKFWEDCVKLSIFLAKCSKGKEWIGTGVTFVIYLDIKLHKSSSAIFSN